LFCAYIIYDWNRALRLPYTVDNAIDAAVALYLDIMNLFIHLLRILGKSQSSS
jgi:FtsH-binding integral membrane protein